MQELYYFWKLFCFALKSAKILNKFIALKNFLKYPQDIIRELCELFTQRLCDWATCVTEPLV